MLAGAGGALASRPDPRLKDAGWAHEAGIGMLPEQNRMRRREEFTSALRGGRRAGGPLLVVHVRGPAPGVPGGPVRVGFVVSRAVGRAVVRNRVRRRLRSLMAQRLEWFPEGSLVVVRATRGAAVAGFAELGADLDRARERLRPGRRELAR